MEINRVWAMPNKWTFEIKPIKTLLNKYITNALNWADPFAGESHIVYHRNDINIETMQPSCLDAKDFLELFGDESLDGILLDPPYSFRQLFKTYRGGGNQLKGKLVPMTEINNIASKKVKPGGIVISFGWNSNGIGKKRGFEILEVLLVAHGGHHNDTIITVEQKIGAFKDKTMVRKAKGV